jgi:tetratricopeptide (TPR) repeat protein
MMSDPETLEPQAAQAIDAEASVLMKHGIRLLADAGSASEALACFDAALELRRRLPVNTSPNLRYGLAACWLNRAEALMRMGDDSRRLLALQAHDEAIRLLADLPLVEDVRFARRLAIAHQNRGLALQADAASFGEAIAAFSSAIAVLERDEAAPIPDRPYLLAAAWTNLANAWVSRPATDESTHLAADTARRAIALVAGLEAADADAAEVGLKARHVLCQILARRLSQPGGGATRADLDEATDAVDDGLTLARGWEREGITRFRGIAYDLFRFGARVYAAYQPQFLNEFVLDNTDPAHSSAGYVESEEMRSAAEEALELAPDPAQ